MATLRNRGNLDTGLFGELRFRAIFVESGHGEEAVAREVRRVVHGDETIRIARVSHDVNANIGGGVLLNCLALADKDFAIDAQQILSLHSRFARHAANEQRPVHAAEALVQVGCRHHAFEQGKRAIIEFHHDTVQRGQSRFDLDEMQNDGWLGPNIEPEAMRNRSE
jgi:hypothetical protein